MSKSNVKLLLIIILTLSVIVGCDTQTKNIPEGVSEEFYDDMVECFKKLEKHKDNDDKNGRDVVQDYLDNQIWLSSTEKEIIKAVDGMYFEVWFYHMATEPDKHVLRYSIQKASELMGIEIDSKKIAK